MAKCRSKDGSFRDWFNENRLVIGFAVGVIFARLVMNAVIGCG